MRIIEKLFGGKEKNVGIVGESVTVFICDLRANSELSKSEQQAYIKAVIAGSHTEVNVSEREIVQLIINWTKNAEPINALMKVLKQINVKFPVKLSELTGENNETFTCETADGKNLKISVYFGDLFDSCDEMHIEYDGKTSRYIYSTRDVSLKLQSTNIVKDGAKISTYYCDFFCHRKLTSANGHELCLEVDEPDPRSESEIRVLLNSDAIEEYILSLALTPITSFYECYQKVKEIYQFSDDIMKSIPKFKLVLSKKIDDKTAVIIEAIVINNGELQMYTHTEGDCTTSWSKDGSWFYTCENGYEVSGNKDGAKVTFLVKKGEITSDVNVADLVQSAEKSVIQYSRKI